MLQRLCRAALFGNGHSLKAFPGQCRRTKLFKDVTGRLFQDPPRSFPGGAKARGAQPGRAPTARCGIWDGLEPGAELLSPRKNDAPGNAATK